MKQLTKTITNKLQALSDAEKREIFPRFFKAGKGEYGEGDRFLGVTVPNIRAIAKLHKDISIEEIRELIQSEWHEVRLCALIIMVEKSKKKDEALRKELFNLYLSQTKRINNWDLVDLSCRFIIGEYLLDKSRDILYQLAQSPLLWDNRIAIVSTYAFIRKGQLEDTYALSDLMMQHPHDLMHKAIGWMLREAGKRNPERLYDYVMSHRADMPRTMLRYAIEKFSPKERAILMKRA
ncbi:DNA alkylation repair protein [Prevotella melaninogenica]|uniref:DNA alkylation repair protein n=1 Tax=Prevotella melaninogenica TaxID=28132 RepID=A0A7D4GII8_9BACT|nr:DNA alkylation repair protein [Prevotella melaninogenica]EFC72284.1 DNA alkylation repair enzyme [Prevotella melaninogenica D18]MBW4734861.1 DNA alkylation repair protein [Prevotella melaninogenica]MBW4737348.1 DNA alkylation repair protein [Prevotella melaninogenica]MBW4879910.1 DNA alkylation repair protein [Prevotella melaninogenica]QKH88906.1 DNA alkylation repair protein [Prevotella melaninogenica]